MREFVCVKNGYQRNVESGYAYDIPTLALVNWFAERDVCGFPGQIKWDCDIDVQLCSKCYVTAILLLFIVHLLNFILCMHLVHVVFSMG